MAKSVVIESYQVLRHDKLIMIKCHVLFIIALACMSVIPISNLSSLRTRDSVETWLFSARWECSDAWTRRLSRVHNLTIDVDG